MIWWDSNSYGGLYIIMKTFLLKNDKNRIYFRNYERISAEEETFLYAECTDTIEKLLKIFEWGEYGR